MGCANGGKPEPKKKKPVKKVTPKKAVGRKKPTTRETAPLRRAFPAPASAPNLSKNDQPAEREIINELSEKHVYFCKRLVLNGGNASKASRESGFNEWYGCTQLAKHQLIIKEVERYRASRAKKFEVSSDRIIAELVKIAFGSLSDFLIIAKDGTPVIDCSEAGLEEIAALAEITQDTYTERTGRGEDAIEEPVKKTRIKMHSKVQALDLLSRIFKMYGIDDGGSDKQTPEEKAQRIRAALLRIMQVDGA